MRKISTSLALVLAGLIVVGVGNMSTQKKMQKKQTTVKVALLVRLEAKPGKEAEVEKFLLGGLPIVQQEPATTTWYAIRLGPTTYGIFDTFPEEKGREAHLAGKVAAALMARSEELFAKPPVIEKVDVLAVKLPR